MIYRNDLCETSIETILYSVNDMLKNTEMLNPDEFKFRLSETQKEAFRQVMKCDDHKIYTRLDRQYIKSNPLWRLTIPVYFIYMLLCIFVICPVKWIVTGSWYIDNYQTAHGNMIRAWQLKIFRG